MNIREQVSEFHRVAQIQTPDKPIIPSDDIVRLRARLINEEYFELLNALFNNNDPSVAMALNVAKTALKNLIDNGKVEVDLVEAADASADLDYVNEGMREYFGYNGEPIAAEVHRSNMTKFPNGVVLRREDGKIIKPATWEPPQIEEKLKEQGWK